MWLDPKHWNIVSNTKKGLCIELQKTYRVRSLPKKSIDRLEAASKHCIGMDRKSVPAKQQDRSSTTSFSKERVTTTDLHTVGVIDVYTYQILLLRITGKFQKSIPFPAVIAVYQLLTTVS